MQLLKHIPGVLAFLVLNSFSLNAQATTVINLFGNGPDTDIHCANNPADANANCWTASKGTGNSRHFQVPDIGTTTILNAFKSGVTGFAGLNELYKADSEDSPLQSAPDEEGGALKDSYSTSFLFQTLDAGDGFTGATISYDGGPSVDCAADCYLLVKDGNQNPAAYLFDLALSGWNGKMDLVLKNFWGADSAFLDDGGSISHVAIYGKISPVPVPAAFWLFGTALLGFIGLSRKTSI